MAVQMTAVCNDFALALAVANGDIERCALQCDVSDALCAPARIAALLGRFLPRLGLFSAFEWPFLRPRRGPRGSHKACRCSWIVLSRF